MTKKKKKKKKNKLTKADKFIIISSIVVTIMIAIPIIIGIVAAIAETSREDAAKKVRAAQIAADPVTVSGMYNALNKERSSVGSSALASNNNLNIAADRFCNDMVTAKYFGYKNPSSGKSSLDFITENSGGQYYKTYVSSIMSTTDGQYTASELVQDAIKNQATNLNNPNFNSVGWSICQSPNNPSEKYIVATLAQIAERPVVNTQPRSNYNSTPTPSRLPVRAPPTTCYSTYSDILNSVTTNCY